MKKPKFSQKLLDTINRVHASASEIYESINPHAMELIPVKESVENNSHNPAPKKMKR